MYQTRNEFRLRLFTSYYLLHIKGDCRKWDCVSKYLEMHKVKGPTLGQYVFQTLAKRTTKVY